jgi:mycofactocin precursor
MRWARRESLLGTPLPAREFGRDNVAAMDNDTLTAEPADDELVEEELLVDEISIDGMCGVY